MVNHRALALFTALLTAACTSTNSLQDFDGDGSLDQNDCNPADPGIHPSAEDPHGDGIDQDCDGSDGVDRDGDGFPANVPVSSPNLDCNDERSDIHPGATDPLSDALDSNCDGHPGVDTDGDGYADQNIEGDDCDDGNDNVHPGAADNLGDSLDSNCDGHDGTDNDGDGFASINSEGSDCDDGEPLTFPGNIELCDGIDNDCSGAVDEGFDQDQDAVTSCGPDGQPDTADDDCDDADPSVHPEAPERCDLRDNDCDGSQPVDEVDGDGDGDPACSDCDDSDSTQNSLDLDADGYSICGADGIPGNGDEDCDDQQPASHPGAPDQWGDLQDTDCDGTDGIDLDGDTWAVNANGPQQDCNDADPASFPGAADPWGDANDSNCDGMDGEDYDNDGWAGNAVAPDADCNDQDSNIFPGAADVVADGTDNNCDGIPGTDNDGDNFAATNSGGNDCNDDQPTGASTHPGAADDWGDDTDSNCDGIDGIDLDGDGFASNATGTQHDCDDMDRLISPAAADNWGDNLDTNCDGLDGVDADGDNYAGNSSAAYFDCDDQDPSINPQADDRIDAQGIDSNCDGTDGIDQDGDGFASNTDATQPDCDDARPNIYPGAPDPPGNGLDEDCDNCGSASNSAIGDGIDTDCDGWALNGPGSTQDCDDSDPDIHPGSVNSAWESPGLEIDINCDGDFSSLLDDARSSGFQCQGEGGGEAGYSIAFAGDINQDGTKDLLIGAPKRRIGFLNSAGAAFLTLRPSFNSAAQPDIELENSSEVLVFEGDQAYQYFGTAIASIGDLDGNGATDIAISGRDAVYIFLGESLSSIVASLPPSTVLQASDADITVIGPTNSFTGMALAGGRDVDADGIPDLLIGAPGSPTDSTSPGRTYLVDGAALRTKIIAGQDSTHAASVSITLHGSSPANDGEHSGHAVAFVDTSSSAADPYIDILIGAPTFPANQWGGTLGASYLVRGADLALLSAGNSIDLDMIGIGFGGIDLGGKVGSALASAGDVDGDGDEDILIGAPETTVGTKVQAGSIYLLLAADIRSLTSPTGSFPHSIEQVASYIFRGESAGDQAGSSVATAGNIDGDHLDDLLIGAAYSSDGGTWSGKTYLVLGSQLQGHGGAASSIPIAPADSSSGEDLSQARAAFSGSTYTRSGSTVAGGQDLDDNGYDDLLIGAPHALSSSLSLNAGKVYVLFGGP